MVTTRNYNMNRKNVVWFIMAKGQTKLGCSLMNWFGLWTQQILFNGTAGSGLMGGEDAGRTFWAFGGFGGSHVLSLEITETL